MGGVLTAIQAIVRDALRTNVVLMDQDGVQNRANQMGEALENYIKNAFADCIGRDSRVVKTKRNETFSYLGNSNNPPDAVLRGGDAIEIKKIENISVSQLQLNSSYPKNKLHSSNSKLSDACRNCEGETGWDEKDLLYVIGIAPKDRPLKELFLIYGDLYCDAHNVYERLENAIRDGLRNCGDLEFSETKELGRVNGVDHLGISDLRVRGMWLIKTPFHQFEELTQDIEEYQFKLVALIPNDKYYNLTNVAEFEDFCRDYDVQIRDERIENPQNPAELINSKLIIYYINETD